MEIEEALPTKNPDDYRVVGYPARRLDLTAKVLGNPAFVHDMSLPGMLAGRLEIYCVLMLFLPLTWRR